MNIRPKTKRRLIILALGLLVLVGAGVGVYLRYVQMHNARLAQYRSAAMSAYASGDYAAALPWFDKYLTLSKTAERGAGNVDTDALYAYGKSRASVELPGARHLWEAKNVFERYLMLKPGDEQAELMLLDIYPRLNHNQEAITLADERLARRPGDVASLKAKTRGLIQKGLQQDPKLFAEAQAVGEKLNAAAPTDLEGLLLTQFAMASAKVPADDVVARAVKGVEDHPGDPRFELVLASAQLYANQPAKAREVLRIAAARKAPDAKFVDELVTRLDALGLYKESLAAMERAIADLGNAYGAAALTRTLVQREWQDGRRTAVLKRLEGTDPKSPTADATLLGIGALTMLQNGRTSDAAPIVDALSARGTSDSVAFAWSTALKTLFPQEAAPGDPGHRAPTSAGTGTAAPEVKDPYADEHLKDSVQKLKSALEKDPGNAFIHYSLAAFYARLGERTLAVESLTQAARRAPAWAEPRKQAARALAEEGRYADAVHVAEDAYRRSRDDLGIVVVWAQAAYGLLDTAPDQKELDRLLRTVEDIQRSVPNEPNTLPILASVLARSGKTDRAAEVVRSALASDPPPPPAVLARLAYVSREANLGLDDEIARRLGSVATSQPAGSDKDPGPAFSAALERLDAGQPQDGLKLLNAARAAAGVAGESLPWRLKVAQYLDAIADPGALKSWIQLTDENPKNLDVQSAALRARCRAQDREFWKRTIERVKGLTVENSQLWRLEEARWLLSGELKPEEQNSVLATLTELARNAPYSAEPRRLLAIAHERAAVAPGATPQAQQAGINQAVKAMQDASDLRPTDVGIAADVARLLRAAGRPEEAGRYFDRAASRPNLDRNTRMRLAELYAEYSQPRKAIDLAAPLGDEVAPRLARWNRMLGRDEEAAALYLKLLAAPSPARLDSQTVLDAATFFGDRGQREQAEKFLAKLDTMRLQPGGRELVRAKYVERYAPEEALRLYKAAAETPGATAGAWRELAGYHLRGRRFSEAAAAAAAGLEHYARDPDLLAMKTRAAELEPFAEDPGAGALINYLSFDPRNAPAGEMLAVLRAAQGGAGGRGGAALAETVAKLRSAADRYPGFLPLQVAAARGHLKLGEPPKAEVVARRATATFPDDVEAVRLLAAVYAATGRWQEVRDTATGWRRLTPGDTLEPDLLIARAQLNANDATGAAERLAPYAKAEAAKALAGADARPDVIDLYARALITEGKADDAASVLEPLAKQSDGWRRVWLDLAGAFRSRDLEAAAAWVTRAEPMVPRDAPREQCQLASAWYVVGRTFDDREALSNARRIVQPLTSAAGDAQEVVPDAWMILAACDEELGNLSDAEREYRKATQLRPGQSDVLNNLAYVLLVKGDSASLGEAKELAHKAIDAAPGMASYYDTLARVEAKQGFPDAAVTSFRRALELDASSVEAMIGLADVLAQTGRRDEARQQLAQIDSAMQLSPHLPAALVKQLEGVRSNLRDRVQSGRVDQ